MKNLLLLLSFVPAISFAQVKAVNKTLPTTIQKKAVAKKGTKKVVKKVENKSVVVTLQQPEGGFLIEGYLKGYPEGTTVNLFNGMSGAAEGTSVLTKGKFHFMGRVAFPDFKVIAVNGAAPYLTLYLDNSRVKINATKDSLGFATIEGSQSHIDFTAFSEVVKPYEGIFSGEIRPDSSMQANALSSLTNYISTHPTSTIKPLAIYRQFQLSENLEILEKNYNSLDASSKSSPVGDFLAKQIQEAKKNPIGQPLADFSQADTAGLPVALSSLKGKYVLVDFWASWCRPCRIENPNLVTAYERFKDKKFTVLGVSLDQSKPAWIEAIKADKLEWTHVSDLKGWGNEVAQKFEIFSIPQNFLLDPQGNVIGKNLRGIDLQRKLEKLLN